MFWVLVFLVGGGCFTWNMEASLAGKMIQHWFHDGLAVSRETQGGVVVFSLLVAWDWGSFNGVFHVKH